jgi:hypothetical protein
VFFSLIKGSNRSGDWASRARRSDVDDRLIGAGRRPRAASCRFGLNSQSTIDYRFRKFNKGFDFWQRRRGLSAAAIPPVKGATEKQATRDKGRVKATVQKAEQRRAGCNINHVGALKCCCPKMLRRYINSF